MGWTFVFMMVALKIPVAALLYLVWWALRQVPEDEDDQHGGGPGDRPPHPRPQRPRPARRGPHGEPPFAPPARVRPARPGRVPVP